ATPALAAAPPAGGVSSPQVTGVELTAPVRRGLKQVEEQWLQWVVQNSKQGSEGVVQDLLATAHQLGMVRLPDLSIGALDRAVQAARQGDFNRAHWALDAAERLDPGRFETAFAEASVDRLEGHAVRSLGDLLRGYLRLFGLPLERYLWMQDMLVWSVSLLLLSGGLFIAVQMAVKGKALWEDLLELFSRRLPRPAALAVAAAVLLWPLLLPSGLLWLPLLVRAAVGLLLGQRAGRAGHSLAAGRPGADPDHLAEPARRRHAVAAGAGHGELAPAPALRRPVHRSRRAALPAAGERSGQAPAGGRPPFAQPVGPRAVALSPGAGAGAGQHLRRDEPRRLRLHQGRLRQRHPALPESRRRRPEERRGAVQPEPGLLGLLPVRRFAA